MQQLDLVNALVWEQLQTDLLLYGTMTYKQLEDGTIERIDPTNIKFVKYKLWDKRNDPKSKRVRHRGRRFHTN